MQRVFLNPATKNPWISSAPRSRPGNDNGKPSTIMNSFNNRQTQNWISDVDHKEKSLILLFPFISPSYIRLSLKMSGYDFKITYKFLSSKLLHNLNGKGNELPNQVQELLTKKLHPLPILLEKKNCKEEIIDLTLPRRKLVRTFPSDLQFANNQTEYPVIVIPDDDDDDDDDADELTLLNDYEQFRNDIPVPNLFKNNFEISMQIGDDDDDYVKIQQDYFKNVSNRNRESFTNPGTSCSYLNKLPATKNYPGISTPTNQQLAYNIYTDEDAGFNPNDKVGIILRKIDRLNKYKVSLL